MKKLIRVISLALLLIAPSWTQPARAWLVQGAVTSSYVGPGDVTTFTAWYGMRAYSNAYAVSLGAAYDWSCSNGSTFTGTVHVIAAGGLNSSDEATISTDCGVAAVSITKFYDQTGGARHVTASVGGDHAVLNCVNTTLTCAQSTGLTVLTGPSFTPATGVASLSAVADRVSGGSTTQFILEASGNPNNLGSFSGANTWHLGSTIFPAAADATWHAGNGVVNGASSALNIDGSTTTGTVTGGTVAGAILVLSGGSSTTVNLAEAGFADNVAWSTTTRTNLCHNQRLYWGSAGSC